MRPDWVAIGTLVYERSADRARERASDMPVSHNKAPTLTSRLYIAGIDSQDNAADTERHVRSGKRRRRDTLEHGDYRTQKKRCGAR